MLGLLLIYFVGKAFYDLASLYQKSQWGFAILGVLSYYLGIFIGGIVIGILFELFSPDSIDDFPDMVLGLIALPIGVLSCWGFYQILKRQWSKPSSAPKLDEVLDQDLLQNR